jgi:hypothetical protein
LGFKLSIRDYLHEKAEESRHNEMFAHLMFIAGAIFFVGGVLETVTTSSNPEWFLFFPYHLTSSPNSILGLALTLCGIALIVYGVGMGIFYAHDRAWYMQELYRAHSVEVSTMGVKKRRKRNNTKALTV